MKDERKTKTQLVAEMEEMRQQRSVEKASERIREEVLAMRTSDDLLQIVFTMFREIRKLDMPAVACSFHFVDGEADSIRCYVVGDHPDKHGVSVPISVLSGSIVEIEDFSYGEVVVDGDIIGGVSEGSISAFLSLVSSVPADFVERWRAGEVWSHREVASETAYMKRVLGKYPEMEKYPFYQDGIVTHVPFLHGTVSIKEKEGDFSQEHVSTVQTLTEALSLGYLRFLDFQQLEQQAEQARRERAVERVRAEAMAMRSSHDLHRVVGVFFQELLKLNVRTGICSLGFMDEENGMVKSYQAMVNLRKFGLGWTAHMEEINDEIVVGSLDFSMSENPQLVENWRRGIPWIHDRDLVETRQVDQMGMEHFGINRPYLSHLNADAGSVAIVVPFTHGVAWVSAKDLSEKDLAYNQVLLKELTTALSLGYLRFLDFQQLEEQNRQLTVERGLEQVRAEVASMRKSADLFKVIGTAEEYLDQLGVNRDGGFGINTIDEGIGEVRLYTSVDSYSVSLQQPSQTILNLVRHWREGRTWNRFYSSSDKSIIPNLRNRRVVDAPFSHGTVAMSKSGPEPFQEEEIHLLERCAEVFSLGYARFLDFQKVDEAQKKLIDELEEELQTAHDLQMGLMPTESPKIDGFDIAGRCIPANHVGGDFFQYFQQDGKLAICMADVTGHAMEAAVPVMMFSGVLKSQMELNPPMEALFGRLNRTMHDSLDSRTYVCFCMGELDIATRSFHLANAACPYPFHFHAATGEVEEMQVDAYPLGVRSGTAYTTIETALYPGDRIVFCSDGIIEAGNEREEIFGFERTSEVIRSGCDDGLSSEALIDRVLSEVKIFAGEAPQGDDQTMVVMVRVD